MQTTSTDNLFQTDAQLELSDRHRRKAEVVKDVGQPIQLSSKALDLVIRGNDAWTAESGWQARRIDLLTGKTKKLYRHHGGPVTCVRLIEIKPEQGLAWLALFTSSWDKKVAIWNADTGDLLSSFEAHADFIKSLHILESQKLLLSSSSDRTVKIWDLTNLMAVPPSSTTPTHLATLKAHTRPIECMASIPATMAGGSSTVYTADSMGVIKIWNVRGQAAVLAEGSSGKRVPEISVVPGVGQWERYELVGELRRHETSVAEVVVTSDGLWSASVDNAAIFHPFPHTPTAKNHHSIVHPTYVKSILPLPSSFHSTAPLVLTGSSDEEIRVWDVTNFEDASGDAKLVSVVEGHFGEVSSLRTWVREEGGKKSAWVLSAGLDSFLRRWTIDDLLNPKPLNWDLAPEKAETGMTAEEEAELAELMDD